MECKRIHDSWSNVSTDYEESLLDDQDDDMDWLADQAYHVDENIYDKDSRVYAFFANMRKDVSKSHLQREFRRKFDEADLS